MPYRIKGTLKLPSGQPAAGVDIEFISRRNYSPLLMDLSSIIKTTSTGAYDITLEYGEYAVVVYWGCNQPSHIGKLFVFSDTAIGLDLQTLLQQADWQPATPEYIQQIQDWLAQANASASQASESAASAKASETAAEADRAEVASNKTIVVNAQADVSAKAADVTAKAAQVAANTATVNEKTPLAVAAADTASQKAVAAAASDASARTSASQAANSAAAAKASETVVEADRVEVASNKTIVVDAQADVIAKAADVTTKAAQVAANAATVNEKTPLAVAAADTASQKAVAAAASDASARDAATRAENAALAMTGAILDGGQCDLSSGFYPQPLTVNGQKYSTVWYVQAGGAVGGITYDAGDKLQYTTANNGFYFRIDARDEVVSVNGEKGAVTLNAQKVGADPAGTAAEVMRQHGLAANPHPMYALKSSLGSAAYKSTVGLNQNASLMEQYYWDFRTIASYDAPLVFPIGVSGGLCPASRVGASGDYVSLLSCIGYADYTGFQSMAQWFASDAISGIGVRVAHQYGDGQVYFRNVHFRTTNNTTVDSNGFIKNASPIARLYGNEKIAESDSEYEKSGCATVNHEAAGVHATRKDIGVYQVTGSLGFATDGWYIETPSDANGNRLLFVEYEQHDNGDILIKTFSPDYSTGRCMAGEPKDIPSGRWIDLRLSMPSKK